MIRSSKHSIKFANTGKLDMYAEFLKEYRKVFQLVVDHIWVNGYDDFNIDGERLNLPMYLDYKRFGIVTNLSARVLRCLVTQASSVIRGTCEKRKKQLYALVKYGKKIKLHKISKPICIVNPELNSICCDIQKGQGFDYFAQLKSLGKSYGKIRIPIKHTKVSRKWEGELMASVSFSDNNVVLRWKIEKKVKIGKSIGVDQGIRNVATLSDGQRTPEKDNHGHSLNSILDKLMRKKKGGKAFKRTCAHRKNFINWSINQLNLHGHIKLEKLYRVKKGNRKLSHWSYPLIKDKIARRCEELGVQFSEQSSAYRSQRCNRCGLVRKANRKGAIYKCGCGYIGDSDLNASLNHVIDLPEMPFDLRSSKLNQKGFHWLPNGFFLDGKELTVPRPENKKDIKVFTVIKDNV